MAARKKPFIVNDETNNDVVFPGEFGRGLELELRGTQGYAGVAKPFPDELLIPESNFQGMIAERKARKRTFRERMKRAGMKVKNQSNLNYCWVFAPTSAVEGTWINQGQPYIELSPSSVGAVIKNGWNVGGWGLEALQHIADVGVAPDSMWPSLSRDVRLNTPAMQAEKAKFRVVDWYVIQENSRRHLISAILRDLLVPIGLNWWRHEVLACDAEWIDGEACPVILNSWGDWGDEGFGVLQGRRAQADDVVAPLTVMAA